MTGASLEDRFKSLQSMLLYQLTGWYRSTSHRLASHKFHPALAEMWKQLDLVNAVKSANAILSTEPAAIEDGAQLEAEWKNWAKVETWKRVSFIVHLLDLEDASSFEIAPLLPFAQLDIELPSRDELWKAKTAQEWQAIHRRTVQINPPPNFLAAIRALLAINDPGFDAFDSPEGRTLQQLISLDSFALLILSRTLSFLEAKTTETIKQSEPFRRMVSGGFKLKEDKERKLLAKIKTGAKWLRSLPGGEERGGGESWLCEVLPEATAKEQPKRTAPTPELLRKIEKDTAIMGDNWPSFVAGESVLDTSSMPESILSSF